MKSKSLNEQLKDLEEILFKNETLKEEDYLKKVNKWKKNWLKLTFMS